MNPVRAGARLSLWAALVMCLLSCGAEPPRSAPPPAHLPATMPHAPAVATPPGITDAAAAVEEAPGVHSSRPLDPDLLERLAADARANDSDDLIVIKDGELAGDWNFTGRRVPIQTMSITKSVLSLLIGCLIDEGKLRLDQPVHDFYPVWRSGDKSRITILHLLSHSTGLEEGKTARDIYASKNFVEFSLRSKTLHEPGTHYVYSNRSANLLSGVIAKASGLPADRYAAKVLFEPLGIRTYLWAKDRAGNVQGLAGLRLLAQDVAKLGELLLARGDWRGRRIVSEDWIVKSALTPASVQPTNKRLGLLWWLIPEWTRVTIDEQIVSAWRAAGTDEAFIATVAPLVERTFTSVPEFVQALRQLFQDDELGAWTAATTERGLADARFEFGAVAGTYASGTLGQYLVIVPRDRLIAVRLRRSPPRRTNPSLDATFPDFIERVRGLVRSTEGNSTRSSTH